MTDQTVQTKPNPLALRETDLRAFIGPNADAYSRYHQKCQVKKKLVGSFVWTAFFFPLIWLAYRKLYFEIVIVVAVAITIGIFQAYVPALERLETAINVGLMVGVAVAGRIFVLLRAAKHVGKADAAGLTGEARHLYLADRGGTSWISAALVGILMLGIAGAMFYTLSAAWA